MTAIDADILQSWDDSWRREWLATNGLGGYASASLSGANTRRYHGLLVPAFAPPLGRAVLFSNLEEDVRVEERQYLLSANKYPGVVQPQGFRHLSAFTTDPVPTFTFTFHEGTTVLEKRVWMAHGRNTVYVRYTLRRAPETLRLGLVPLLAYKKYHDEQRRWDGFTGETTFLPDGRLQFVAFPNAHPLFFTLSPVFAFADHSGWFYNFEHGREAERGLPCVEDLFCPGRWDGTLAVGQSVTLTATVETDEVDAPEAALASETARKRQLLTEAGVGETDGVRAALTLAADQFVIEKCPKVARATVIAGYPWFGDWGRDTMISLPGLCLTTKRFDVAREILTTFAGATRNGLLPNCFADDGSGAEYNTVDASLWFIHAVHAYAEASGDWEFAVNDMRPVIKDILDCYTRGTDYGIGVDEADGLLQAGEPGVQLTWMDVKVGDWVVTPRIGKPVEINALWHNALCVATALARRAGDESLAWDTRAGQVRVAFEKFVNPDGGLYDVIAPDGTPDTSVRPNQIFAVSLPFAPVPADGPLARGIIETVQSRLLTPFGLRTLASGSPEYAPRYGPGDQSARDGAYHQGTVWPWLLGAFVDAHLKVYNDPDTARAFLAPLLADGLSRCGVGTLSEICDADPPFSPNGCPAQAWSVAEVLRALAKVSAGLV